MMLDVIMEFENWIPEKVFANLVTFWHTMFKGAPDFIEKFWSPKFLKKPDSFIICS